MEVVLRMSLIETHCNEYLVKLDQVLIEKEKIDKDNKLFEYYGIFVVYKIQCILRFDEVMTTFVKD